MEGNRKLKWAQIPFFESKPSPVTAGIWPRYISSSHRFPATSVAAAGNCLFIANRAIDHAFDEVDAVWVEDESRDLVGLLRWMVR